MWVRAFRKGIMEVSVNRNNGAERKYKDFKYQYLHKFKDKLQFSVEQFLVKKYER